MSPLPALAEGASLPDCAAVLELLAARLASAPGRRALAQLQFHRERERVIALQARLGEALAWRQRRGSFAFAAVEDLEPILGLARVAGATLAAPELREVQRHLDAVEALREHAVRWPEAAAPPWPGIAVLAAAMPRLDPLHQALARTFLANGDIADDASPLLRRLRRDQERQRERIQQSLQTQMRRLAAAGVLQEELVTLRNERYVLPVRAGERTRVAGVVHGASSSGQTVFVEPLETIELNNEYHRLRDAEAAELERILRELTAQTGAAAAELAAQAAVYGELELELAKAEFALEFQAQPAAIAPAAAPRLALRELRHPVLEARLRREGGAMTPLTLTLDGPRLLVISGPNTGGKTVVLKSVGMAAWMAQCGLPVCAAAAELPVFDGIHADIGDAQSLELSLSTFSSHLRAVRRFLAAAGPDSLVLLDELGTATNPAEGAVLAEAIAAALLAARAWVLITTHHDALKAWAATAAGALNGSVGVAAETLAPDYRFRQGVPGASAGLAMAEQSGLPAALIADARRRLSQSHQQAGEYLERLQQLLAAAEARERALAGREAAAAEREAALDAREAALGLREQRDRRRDTEALRAAWDRRFAALGEQLEAQWRSAVAELQLSSRRAAEAAGRLRREREEAAAAARAELMPAAPASAPPAEIRAGDRVRLRHPPGVGVVVGAGEPLEIEIGRLRLRAARAEVVEVLAAAATRPAAEVRPAPAAVRELNLIGQRAEEAADALERFLDQALLSGAERLRIIHGHGSGSLRRRVAEVLRGHAQVAAFSHPTQPEGGQGVTLVELK